MHNFQGQKHFWTKCVQIGFFLKIINFALLIINIKILSNFKNNGAHLVEKKDIWKKQRLSIFKVWVFSAYKNIFYLCQALSM
jgi:hypothetical protein